MDDLISRHAAITLPIMPKEYRKHKPIDCDDAYEQGWSDCQSCIGRLPTAEPNHDGFLEFLFNVINPNEMEQYMAMYNSRSNCGARMEESE